MAYKIVASQCTVCGACEFECPNAAISLKRDIYVIDAKNVRSARAIATRRNARWSVRCPTPVSRLRQHKQPASRRLHRSISRTK